MLRDRHDWVLRDWKGFSEVSDVSLCHSTHLPVTEKRPSGEHILSPNVIQIEIQFYHIDTGFAQQAEGTAFRVPSDELPHDLGVKSPSLCHPSDLVFGGRGADLRVKPAGRGGYEIHGNRGVVAGVGRSESGNSLADGFR
jgi:hypothetical protein